MLRPLTLPPVQKYFWPSLLTFNYDVENISCRKVKVKVTVLPLYSPFQWSIMMLKIDHAEKWNPLQIELWIMNTRNELWKWETWNYEYQAQELPFLCAAVDWECLVGSEFNCYQFEISTSTSWEREYSSEHLYSELWESSRTSRRISFIFEYFSWNLQMVAEAWDPFVRIPTYEISEYHS